MSLAHVPPIGRPFRPCQAPHSATERDKGKNTMDEIRLLDLKEVCARVGVSKSTLYRMISERRFPQARQLGPNRVAWRSDEITAWIDALMPAFGMPSGPAAALAKRRLT